MARKRARGGWGRALGRDEVFTHSLSVQDKTRNLTMRRSSMSGIIYYVIITITITIIIIILRGLKTKFKYIIIIIIIIALGAPFSRAKKLSKLI